MERAGVDVDHRRRDAARELLEPLRDRARRRRPRQPRRRARPDRPRRTRCRGSSGRSAATRPVEVRDVEFLRSLTDRRIKITVPGPFTMTQQAQNDHYADERSLALAYAEAVNEELHDLEGRRRGRRPDRRAVPAGAPRAGARVRARGDRPRARRDRGRHGAAHLLRVRAHRPRPAARLPVPARAERLCGDARLDRGRAARTSTRRCCAALPDKTIMLGVLDLGVGRGGDAGGGRGADPRGARRRRRRSGSSSRPTAA